MCWRLLCVVLAVCLFTLAFSFLCRLVVSFAFAFAFAFAFVCYCFVAISTSSDSYSSEEIHDSLMNLCMVRHPSRHSSMASDAISEDNRPD